MTPPCVTFRRVAVSLRGPGQSLVLSFVCCVGSLRPVGRCGLCSPPLPPATLNCRDGTTGEGIFCSQNWTVLTQWHKGRGGKAPMTKRVHMPRWYQVHVTRHFLPV